MTNPFIINGKIPEAYFCDREKETRMIIDRLSNGHNIVLASPRRIGKTGLIEHCYQQAQMADFNTFFIDILQTGTLRELTYMLGKQIFEQLKPLGRNMLDLFVASVKSLQAELGYDITTGIPKFNLSLGSIRNPQYTMEEIFNYINTCGKHCIIAIDEFQQIAHYPEKGVEAMLRTYIQHCTNANFIFAGSEQHLLTEMFNSYARPFYQSATMMSLEAIPLNKYSDFAIKNMAEKEITIQQPTIEYIYKLFDGNTYCMQKIFNIAYYEIESGNECKIEHLDKIINDILDENNHSYSIRLSNMSSKPKELLYAIASDGKANNITSGAFIRQHHLESASSVQSAVKQLLSEDWITYDIDEKNKKTYHVTDPFLALWLQR